MTPTERREQAEEIADALLRARLVAAVDVPDAADVIDEHLAGVAAAALPDPARNALGAFGQGDGASTARKAALEHYPRSGEQREAVLLAVAAAGPAGVTSDEIHQTKGILLASVKPRLVELRRGGWIERTGGQRPSLAGKPVDVHRLTADGEARLRAKEAVDHAAARRIVGGPIG